MQGWLKGTLEGDDSDSYIAKQAFNFGIHYFDGDYSAINGSTPFVSTHLPSGVPGGSLYNGNISAMKIAIPKIGEPVLHTYKYDQLNRIKEVNNYNSYNPSNNTWTTTNAHKELLSFDANGNIQTALLNGSSASLPYQNLAYTYDGVKKNRLLNIHNSVGNVTSEYEYDAIGNVTKDELEGNENMEWNVYGKLKSLEKVGSGTAISFGYDASGNRISKKVGTTKQQWYVRDASGNIMATYIKENAINGGDLSTEMFNMYGSSMLGGWKLSVNIETMPPPANNGELERGNQEFYFSNHLGNNLVILSDRKEGIQDTGNPTQVTGYEPYVLSATDYSAYGENLIGREYNPGKIKFGFNGKWNDFETGYQDYGMRMSSSKRRGFVSVDPITKKYPMLTPYQFASNRPVDGVDLDGLEYLTNTLVFESDGLGPAKLINSYYVWHDAQEHNSHGKLGKGVKYNILIIDKKTKSQLFSESRFVSRDAVVLGGIYNADYGNYMGPTSLYKFGDGGYYNENFSKTYDYSLPAVDAVDNLAKLHDIGYDRIGAKGENSLMNDWGTTPIDIDALQGWQEIIINKDAYPDVNKKGRHAAINASTLFSYVATKKIKEISNFMRKNYSKETTKDANKNYQLFLGKYMQKDAEGNWTRKEDMWHKDKNGDYKPNTPKKGKSD